MAKVPNFAEHLNKFKNLEDDDKAKANDLLRRKLLQEIKELEKNKKDLHEHQLLKLAELNLEDILGIASNDSSIVMQLDDIAGEITRIDEKISLAQKKLDRMPPNRGSERRIATVL